MVYQNQYIETSNAILKLALKIIVFYLYKVSLSFLFYFLVIVPKMHLIQKAKKKPPSTGSDIRTILRTLGLH